MKPSFGRKLMFEGLKKKLREIKEKIRRKAETAEEAVEEPRAEAEKAAPPQAEEPRTEVERALPQRVEEPEKEKHRIPALPAERPKRGLRRAVKRITGRELSAQDLDDVLWDLQVALLESDVAVPVADEIISSVRDSLVGRRIGLREDPKKLADEVLRGALMKVLTPGERFDLDGVIREKRERGEPAVIVFVGINGTGKTTTIAKLAKYLMDRGYRVVVAAADTFRAAGIEQLEIHAQRLGVPLIKQRRGADAAAVAFDAISHAKAKQMDVVLIDTAGRMQTEANLMDEMRKIVRVTRPDAVIFVGDALTGNDAVEQAKAFDEAVGITGSILCKMDADARGGAALSISHVTRKPILFIGTGQGYDDLLEFNPRIILDALFGD
ncbi:MAG: signal recognition particle-docking protein FtsY [Candidatus Hadarchaeales archaeon]